MSGEIRTRLFTMCMVRDRENDKVLLLHRTRDSFAGFVAPGGKVEFPESLVEGAIREVKEETGLCVTNLKYRGLWEFVNEEVQERYMVFHYLTDDFTGELLEHPPEGALHWVPIAEVESLPLPASFRKRWPWWWEPGVFEYHGVWADGAEKEGWLHRV